MKVSHRYFVFFRKFTHFWKARKFFIVYRLISKYLFMFCHCLNLGVTKPLFVNKKGLKVSAKNYRKHLQKELFPAINKIYPRKDWIFIQDGATPHTINLIQDFLKETIPWRYIKKDQWPPKSPDNNPLDYYFWNKVKTKVYEDRLNTPFESEEEMISKIKSVWKEYASNLVEIRKSMKEFSSRLLAVNESNGYSI